MSDEKDIIYLVPHTHYDAIWIFTKEDYLYINIDVILKKVVEIMEKSKDYKFVIEQVHLLEEVERRYPELFNKIKELIKQERIEIVDGEYVMADTMLPQEETLIREILYGKRYVKKKFGVDVKVMWVADSFGLNAQLPQIYRKCGYKYVAFRRGCPEIKPSEFLWEGLDGTRIIAHFFPLGYRAGLYLNKLEESYVKLKRCALTNHILMPSGSGSMPPQEETPEVVKEWNKKHDSIMKIATPSEFFREIEKYKDKMPIRKGEMYSGKYSEVFPDTCSSRIWVKQNLRKFENWLLFFERFSTINYILGGDYKKEEIDNCWKKVMFMAFHDVVPGTGMDFGYADIRQDIDFLRTKLGYLTQRVLHEIIERDANNEDFGDIVVFNPLSWEVTNWVEVDLNFEEGQIYKIEGLKCGDEEIDVEVLRFRRYDDESLSYVRIGFVATVPPLGYKVYKIIEKRKKRRKSDNFIRIVGNTIETKHFNVTFSPENGLITVTKNGKVVFKDGNEIVIESEIGDLYHHKEYESTPVIKSESGEGLSFGDFRVKNFWIEKSPLRRVINIHTDYFSVRWPYRYTERFKTLIWRQKKIAFRKKIIVYRDIPRIDFITYIDSNHPRIRLRVRFKTDKNLPEYTCECQFGAINRKTNMYYFNPKDWKEKPSGVYPSLRWIDYSDGEIGFAVLNRGTPENEVRNGNVYITLLRSVDILSDGTDGPVIPVPDAREEKRYTFKYAAYPHEGDWRQAKVYKMGYEFNYHLIALQIPRNKKYRLRRSFLKIEPDNVILTALKLAEDKDGIVVRFYEAEGKDCKAKLEFFRKIKTAKVVNMLEETDEEFEKEFGKDLKINGNVIELDMKPFEVVTLKVTLE